MSARKKLNGAHTTSALLVAGLLGLLTGSGTVFLVSLGGLLAAALPQRISPTAILAAGCAGPIAAGVLWLPMQVLLYDGIGFMVTPVYAISAGLVTMTAMPLLTRGASASAPTTVAPMPASSMTVPPMTGPASA